VSSEGWPATFFAMGSKHGSLALVVRAIHRVLAAVRADRGILLSATWRSMATIALSLPTLLVCLLANCFSFAHTLGWGLFHPEWSPRANYDGRLDRLWHLMLPIAVLAFVLVCAVESLPRSAMIEILTQDYIQRPREKDAIAIGTVSAQPRPSRAALAHAHHPAGLASACLGSAGAVGAT